MIKFRAGLFIYNNYVPEIWSIYLGFSGLVAINFEIGVNGLTKSSKHISLHYRHSLGVAGTDGRDGALLYFYIIKFTIVSHQVFANSIKD